MLCQKNHTQQHSLAWAGRQKAKPSRRLLDGTEGSEEDQGLFASHHPSYRQWHAMKSRCFSKTCKSYYYYGGRGISICDRWSDFWTFVRDMGKRPSPDHGIDRIDNNGNYEPSNCRWATQAEQNRNKRNTIKLKHAGETKSLVEWAKILGITPLAIWCRIKRGWPIEKALTSGPVAKGSSLAKLNKNQTEFIRRDLRPDSVIAKMFSVSRKCIWNVRKGVSYIQ